MGSSVKKKKDKKKDFQKAKLKVGKTKAKAANFTDTSFKAKSIVVGRQSISINAPSSSAQFSHHVSLLQNRSDSQRSESLAHLTAAVLGTTIDTSIPEPVATLLPKLLPLLLDGAPSVRRELLKLLKALSIKTDGIRGHADRVLLYIHAAMTHLSADIRGFAIDALDWLLECARTETVGCAGGWTKTLTCFMGLFGWRQLESEVPTQVNGWTTHHQSGIKPGSQSKVLARQLASFANFLRAGLGRKQHVNSILDGTQADGFPLVRVRQHLLPQRSNAFAHLNLFGPPPDGQAQILEDREDRQRVLEQRFRQAVLQGVDTVVKEGGDLGRAAAAVRKAVTEGLVGYEVDDSV